MDYNKHYIRLDVNNFIVKGFSDAFEKPELGDICINKEGGRHFELLGEVNPILFDGFGSSLYKYNNESKTIYKTTKIDKQESLLSRKTLEQFKTEKITELSFICNKIIETGFDVVVSTGSEHFSLTYYDQLQIKSLSDKVKEGYEYVPYHADGKACRLYAGAEMMTIANSAENYVTYNTTYFNQIKQWINSCETKEEVNLITWGSSLPVFYDNIFKSITGVSTIVEIKEPDENSEPINEEPEVEVPMPESPETQPEEENPEPETPVEPIGGNTPIEPNEPETPEDNDGTETPIVEEPIDEPVVEPEV